MDKVLKTLKQITMQIKKAPFLDILRGEKAVEYRNRSVFWDKKLSKTDCPFIAKFINGYGRNRPYFICIITKLLKTDATWDLSIGDIIDHDNLCILKEIQELP